MRQALPSSSLFGQLRTRLSKEAWAAVKIDTLERSLLDLFNCTTIFSKMDDIKNEQDASPRQRNTSGVSRSDSDQSHADSEPDVAFCEAMWSYFTGKTGKETSALSLMAVFLKSLDSHSAKSNDVRFYMDLLIGNSGNSQKKCQVYLNLRKFIMAQRQETNYPGTVMDRIHYNFEEWSSLVERYLGHLQNFPNLLPVLHNLIDGLSRKNQNLKCTRENQNRLSMTTLVEAMTVCLTSQDKNFDDTGKHVLEEKLSLVNCQKGVVGSKARSGHKEGQAAAENSAFNNSPLRAIEFYCENQTGAAQLLESKPGIKMTENGGAVKNSDSQPKRYLIESVKPDQISDPTLDFMRDKKQLISAELKEVQESKNLQMAQVIRSLAELNILNKEMKHMDADYLQASKKFDTSFRVYMGKYGKTRLKKYDIDTFNKIAQQRKKVDYVANLNAELGSAFLKFTTSNLLKIKSEEVKFFETLQKIKKKSWKYVESKDQEKSHDEPDEESQNNSPTKGNRFEQLKVEKSPGISHTRLVEPKNKEFESPMAKHNAKQHPLNEEPPHKKEVSQKVDPSKILLIRTTPSRDKQNRRLPDSNPKLYIDIQTEHIAKVRQPVVERIKIERGNYSDDESDGST